MKQIFKSIAAVLSVAILPSCFGANECTEPDKLVGLYIVFEKTIDHYEGGATRYNIAFKGGYCDDFSFGFYSNLNVKDTLYKYETCDGFNYNSLVRK